MHWMAALGENARLLRGRLRLQLTRRTWTTAKRHDMPASEVFLKSTRATKPEGAHRMLCPRCLYEEGSVLGMMAVRPRDHADPNSFSCSTCGRGIDV